MDKEDTMVGRVDKSEDFIKSGQTLITEVTNTCAERGSANQWKKVSYLTTKRNGQTDSVVSDK